MASIRCGHIAILFLGAKIEPILTSFFWYVLMAGKAKSKEKVTKSGIWIRRLLLLKYCHSAMLTLQSNWGHVECWCFQSPLDPFNWVHWCFVSFRNSVNEDCLYSYVKASLSLTINRQKGVHTHKEYISLVNIEWVSFQSGRVCLFRKALPLPGTKDERVSHLNQRIQ